MLNINVDTSALWGAVKNFKQETKTDRVFFREDSAFAMKCEGFFKAAASLIKERDGDALTVVDKSLYNGNESPVEWTIRKEDVLAILDNTKVGLFGNILKKECEKGLLVTTKGLFALNVFDGTPTKSGFLSWNTVANCTKMGGTAGEYSVQLFTEWKGIQGRFRKGPRVFFWFENAKIKNVGTKLEKLINHLKFIAKGSPGEFDNDEYAPDYSVEG